MSIKNENDDHLNLEQDLHPLQGRDDRLADGSGNAAGHEVQQEVVIHHDQVDVGSKPDQM